MAAPILLTPLAWTALRYGALAAMAVYAARSRGSQPKDVVHDRTLDDLPEGIVAHPHKAEGESALHGHGRLRRVVRLGRSGPAVEIDAAGIARFRFRRVG
jgi:hypothetical protein